MDTLAAAMNKACIAYPTYASQIDEATYEERKADLDAIFRKAAAFAWWEEFVLLWKYYN